MINHFAVQRLHCIEVPSSAVKCSFYIPTITTHTAVDNPITRRKAIHSRHLRKPHAR